MPVEPQSDALRDLKNRHYQSMREKKRACRFYRARQPGRSHGAAHSRRGTPDYVVGTSFRDAGGARRYRSGSRRVPAALAAASNLVCLCVVGDADVAQVAEGAKGVLSGLTSGGIIAIHSTVHPDTCREIALLAAQQGVQIVDAPVSGGGQAAAGTDFRGPIRIDCAGT